MHKWFKRWIKDRRGYAAPIGVLIVYVIAGGIIANGVTKTALNGTLKKNGQKIWCKMQNKGADYCNANY